MTIPRSIVLALSLIAGVVGALVARAVPSNDGPGSPLITPASSVPSDAARLFNECNAERTELASAKLQLAVCMAVSMPAPMATAPDVPEASAPDPSESPEIKRNRELLDSDSEVVIVRRTDGTIGIYKPDEWPPEGDGVIIGRKFPDGEFGWYSKPIAGSRATEGRMMFRGTSIDIEPDGRITVRGKPAPASVIRMLGGKVDEPDGG